MIIMALNNYVSKIIVSVDIIQPLFSATPRLINKLINKDGYSNNEES